VLDKYVFEGVSVGDSVSKLYCSAFACNFPWQGESWIDIRQLTALASVIGERYERR
jgi:hypothetical protein